MATNSEVKIHERAQDDFNVIDLGTTLPAYGNKKPRGEKLTVLLKGGKTKQITIPRAVVAEVKRVFRAAFWDNETLDSPAGTVSRYSFLADVSQGTTADARLGDVIKVLGLRIRFIAYQSTGVVHDSPVLDLIQDNEPAAGLPVWSDVYQGIGAANSAAYAVAIPNYDKRFRFRYLNRKVLVSSFTAAWDNSGTPQFSTRPIVGEIDVKLDRRVEYDVTTAVIKGIGLHLFGWGLQTSDTTRVTASYELFFQDA